MGSAGADMPVGDDRNNPRPTDAAAAAPISIMEFLHGGPRRVLEPPHAAVATAGSSSSSAAAGPTWLRRVRLRTAGAEASSSSSSPPAAAEGSAGSRAQECGDEEEERWLELTLRPPSGLPAAARAWPAAFGFLSTQGRLPHMEDTVSLRPGFHTWVDGSPMHFFAVFDGHGGSHVSELCRDRMHEFLAEELVGEAASFLVRRELATAGGGVVGTSSSAGACWAEHQEEELAWRAALSRAFGRIDAMAALPCACGRIARSPCECPRSMFTGYVGSTAVVALLARGRVVVANCGDSRAVLCRGPAGAPPVPLSLDHKPNRPDEVARIRAAGGQLMYNRVRGVLAMTRALGDRKLRPEVIAEPEINITQRTVDDQCLILASDGMWDVISNETACHVTRQCLEYGNLPPTNPSAASSSTIVATTTASSRGHGAESSSCCFKAAWVLGRLALARETVDNISIIVLDLRQREW
ncbi:unnamed protein product [Urochloa humidicola]